MKKTTRLLLLLVFMACENQNNKEEQVYVYDEPKKVTLTGTVSNFDPENPNLNFTVNRIGVKRLQLDSKIDSSGHFSVSFDSYTPVDVWVRYDANFMVLTYPGDSINLAFDVEKPDRVAMLESLEISGDAAETNQDAAHFQKMYYADELYTDWDKKEKTKKEYDVEEYKLYLDTLQQKSKALLDEYRAKYKPNEEALLWAKINIEQDYYDALDMYPDDHRRSNGLGLEEWDVPDDYYDELTMRLPITKPMLLNGYALGGFVNSYHYSYAKNKTRNEKANEKYRLGPGMFGGSGNALDSLNVYGIIKYTKDTLLQQMVLAELFQQDLERSKLDLYETYDELIDTVITEPFLAEPLKTEYQETKQRIEEPELVTEAILKKSAGTAVEEVIDELFESNRGKVIYVDTWASWCAPCLSEFPNSKNLMEELEDQDVVFAYFAIDTQEKAYKATLDKYQLGGEHYFLDENQSADYTATFEISSIPYYILIDKEGNIVDSGSHLRPYEAKEKIEELL